MGNPDIAAVGSNHYVYMYEIKEPVAGTSASCPTASALIGALNGALIDKGKKPLGFLNPLLYQNAHLFHDITLGFTGWYAAEGWDPTTGLGTMSYPPFLNLVLSQDK